MTIFLIANTALQVSAKIDINETSIPERWDGRIPALVYINGSIDAFPNVKASYLEKWEGKVSNFGYFNENLLKYMPVDNAESLYIRHRMIEDETTRYIMMSYVSVIVILLLVYSKLR